MKSLYVTFGDGTTEKVFYDDKAVARREGESLVLGSKDEDGFIILNDVRIVSPHAPEAA